jgi:hypothetical protein
VSYANAPAAMPNQNARKTLQRSEARDPILPGQSGSHLNLASSGFLPHGGRMKRIALAALTLSLCSCQTAPESTSNKDYAALAAAEVARHTISNDNVYGFEPEGQYSQTLPLLDTRKESVGTVYRLADQKNAYDWVDVTVDETGTIIRLQFFKRAHTNVGWQNFLDQAYMELKTKYKAVQRNGDRDTTELTVYVAGNEAEWKQRYIQYLQLMDEPNNLGAQNCWILHPHLNLIHAVIKRQSDGATLSIDYQTKKYAEALKRQAPPAK